MAVGTCGLAQGAGKSRRGRCRAEGGETGKQGPRKRLTNKARCGRWPGVKKRGGWCPGLAGSRGALPDTLVSTPLPSRNVKAGAAQALSFSPCLSACFSRRAPKHCPQEKLTVTNDSTYSMLDTFPGTQCILGKKTGRGWGKGRNLLSGTRGDIAGNCI